MEEYLRELFEELNKNDIRYAVLRGYETLPSEVSHDIDLGAHPDDFMKMFSDAKIDLNEDIPYPPNVLSIGEHTYGQSTYPTTFGTEGNFSAITGAGKSRKSFFKSLLVGNTITPSI